VNEERNGLRVLVTGGTGGIGRRLVPVLLRYGYSIRLLVRSPLKATQLFLEGVELVPWRGEQELPGEVFAGISGVINLAGAPIARRWTAAYRQEILRSRVATTYALSRALCRLEGQRPAVFVSVSATGYYGDKGEQVCTENTPPGDDFLAQVCQQWEVAAWEAAPCVRLVIARLGIVLDRESGFLARLLPSFRAFAGGVLGSGAQWVPWVHWQDVVGFFLWALQTPTAQGVYNVAAPEPVRLRQMCQMIGQQLRRPCWLSIPVVALRLLYGGLADALCASQRAIPERALREGFRFRFSTLSEALQYELQ